VSPLEELVETELTRPASSTARSLANEIATRHGGSLVAVLFYGSCLRRGTHEGVLDFYAIVDSYASAYDSRWLSLLNAALAPNVFYLECESAAGTLRAKYAVISSKDFARAVSPRCRNPYIWARFAQPALLVYARDGEARDAVRRWVSQAIVTLVRRMAVFLPAKGRVQRYSLAALWQEALKRTYSAEFRSESPEMIRSIYQAASERFDRAGAEALRELAAEGWIDRVQERGNAVEVEMSLSRRTAARLRWALTRPLAKALALLRLLKTALTFGDWVPYVLWKIERHSGVHIEPTERQRRHPLIFGWPVLIRLLRRGDLR
jgi:hypothetical protein